MLKILTAPNPVLTTPSVPIISFDAHLRQLVSEMEETLLAQDDPQGVGLAAPQIGKNIAVFIIKPNEKSDTEVFINPKILKVENLPAGRQVVHRKKDAQLEGCLSIPRIWAPIRRAPKILIEYQDATGEKKEEWLTSFKAIIVQHEVDHLNGVLFTQRAIENKMPLYEEKNGELEKLEY